MDWLGRTLTLKTQRNSDAKFQLHFLMSAFAKAQNATNTQVIWVWKNSILVFCQCCSRSTCFSFCCVVFWVEFWRKDKQKAEKTRSEDKYDTGAGVVSCVWYRHIRILDLRSVFFNFVSIFHISGCFVSAVLSAWPLPLSTLHSPQGSS